MQEMVHARGGLEWDTPLYAQATTQLEHALALADVPDFVANRLRYPERALIVSLPVRLDDGTLASFPAYRVQHSSVLGPTKGGVRYDPPSSRPSSGLNSTSRPDMATNEQTMAWMMDTYSMQKGYAVPEAILVDRGIPVLPDILTNVGGVTVSYFEWVQDLGRLFRDRDEIRRPLADKPSDAFDRVWAVAQDRGITLRDAALVAAIHEVSAALEARGIYP